MQSDALVDAYSLGRNDYTNNVFCMPTMFADEPELVDAYCLGKQTEQEQEYELYASIEASTYYDHYNPPARDENVAQEEIMFHLVQKGAWFGFRSVATVSEAIKQLRDTSIEVRDLRPEGRWHHLTVEIDGSVHETHGSRLIVKDVGLLLTTPGRPVYA
jgi:hypothetical protein